MEEAMERPRFQSDPEAYGIDLETLDWQQLAMWNSQELFLSQYAGKNTKASTAARIGISRATVARWEKDNALNFGERLAHAHEHTVNIVEDKYMEILLTLTSKSSPLWMFGWLKANARDKWGDASVSSDDTSKEMLSEMQKLRKEWQADRKAAQAESGPSQDDTPAILKFPRQQSS